MQHPVDVRLLEALIPPTDFELTCLVGTTYSLDPGVFLAILSAASIDWANRGGTIGFDSLAKEEWRSLILEKRHNSLMFVDHHGPFETAGGSLNPLEKLSLDQIIKSRGRDTQNGGSLHSKLILALYKSSAGRVAGRVFVGSKNFTRSQMQEFGAVYDLRQSSEPGANRSFTTSLCRYLQQLRDVEVADAGPRKVAPLNKAIELLRTKSLAIDDPSCAFHWQGREATRSHSLATQLAPLLDGKWERAFFHSPWTRVTAVRQIADRLAGIPIRIACLKEPGLSTLNRPNVRYQLSYSATGLVQPHQSHSKVYLFENAENSLLVFGSANLTADGWGLPVAGCRPNAEILVSSRVKTADYRYLTEVSGGVEDIKPSVDVPTEQEEALAFLNSIEVRVSFDRERAHLRYEIDASSLLAGFKRHLLVSHDLIEAAEHDAVRDIEVCHAWPLPREVEVPWSRADLYRVSSLVRIRCPALSVETHLVVDLDAEFYEGRVKLRVLQYKAIEILESLAQLMKVMLPATPLNAEGSGGGHSEHLSALLDGLRVERYSYKMARLKNSEPTSFRRTIDRVDKLLAVAKDHKSLSGELRLQKLIGVLEAIHDDLDRT
jgi:hypothetical protein